MAAFPQPIQPIPPRERWYVSTSSRVYVFARRSLVILSPMIAIYVLVGSCLYPGWWFGLLWGGHFNRDYVADGLGSVPQENFGLLLSVVIAAFVLTVLGLTFRTHLPHFLDNFGGYVLVTSGFVLLTTSLVVYHTQWLPYTVEQTLEMSLLTIQRANREIASVGSHTAQHVAGPVDFHFINSERIVALYSQIESDLSEEKRVVSSTGNIRGKAGVAAGVVTAEAEGNKGATSTSSFTKTELSSSKKCLSVMNNIIDTQSPKHYSSREEWILLKASADRALRDQENMGEPNTRDKMESLRIDAAPTPEQLMQEAKKTKEYDAELQGELQSLRGYVFVEGEFERTADGDSVTLIRKFSTPGDKKVAFRFSLPKSGTQGIPEMSRLYLRIFGDVLHPVDDGYVDLRVLAVY